MTSELVNLPLELQTALAGGYLAYWIAYVGLDEGRRGVDVAFRSFAFGLPAIAVFRLLADVHPMLGSAAGVSISILIAGIWRMKLAPWLAKKFKELKIHNEDGIKSTWTALIQQKDLKVGQLSVHTKDGRVLYQHSNTFKDAHLGGMYFGQDGSILMVVEDEELPDGKTETRQGVRDPDWGTRVTYIPADQVARVNVR